MIYSRPLHDDECVDTFINNALGYEGTDDIIQLIVEGELGLIDAANSRSTMYKTSHRQKGYRDDSVRWKLRKEIVNQLFTLQRPPSDDEITFGKGGALPQTEQKKESLAFILLGLPASGKSGIANVISDHYGAIILDSDFAKRKLPEFNNYKFGASLVNDESKALVFKCDANDTPDDFETLYDKCVQQKLNIVIPKIGYDYNSIHKLANKMAKAGYVIHLTLVALDRRKATLRAIERYRATKRYVPLGLIFDQYSNDPILNYYIFKNNNNGLFASFGQISTDVNIGEPVIVTETDGKNPANLFK